MKTLATTEAMAVNALAAGALAVGALAVGALAAGALATGALVAGALAVELMEAMELANRPALPRVAVRLGLPMTARDITPVAALKIAFEFRAKVANRRMLPKQTWPERSRSRCRGREDARVIADSNTESSSHLFPGRNDSRVRVFGRGGGSVAPADTPSSLPLRRGAGSLGRANSPNKPNPDE